MRDVINDQCLAVGLEPEVRAGKSCACVAGSRDSIVPIDASLYPQHQSLTHSNLSKPLARSRPPTQQRRYVRLILRQHQFGSRLHLRQQIRIAQ